MGLTTTLLRSPLVAALASPHGIDRYLEQVDPMWAVNEVRARVVDVRREVDGDHPVATLTLQPTRTWAGHRAGQHVQVGLDLPGAARRLTRVFTISSAASAPGEPLTLTVRAHDHTSERASVSRFLVEDARPGQLLHLSQAMGDFTLPVSPATPGVDPLLFVTGGSGITPAMSMVRTLLRDGYDGKAGRPVTFVHFARSPEDQIYATELAEIAEADNGVTVHLVHDDLFSTALLDRLVPRWAATDTWACGPEGLIDLVRAAYADSERLRLELFKAPTVASGSTEGTVTFARAGASADNSGASLLEQAEALGLRPESGCRRGICFSCTTRKTDGTVRNLVTGATSSQPDEDIQICVSAPEGDCTLDL